MSKRLFIIFLLLLLISGCSLFNNNGKMKLSSKYYNKGEFIKVSSDDINDLKNDKYVVYIYNNFCSFTIPCEDIFYEFMQKNKIDFLSIPFDDYKDTYLYEKVKYAPSIIIVDNGEIVAFLDAESDEDLIRYQDVSEFKNWITQYVNI